MLKLFMEGGPWFMAILTVLLVAVFFAAWKAPRWVKEIGTIALTFGFFSFLLGVRQIFDYIANAGAEVPAAVLCGGLKVSIIPVLYGMIIYVVALIIRIVQKPRL